MGTASDKSIQAPLHVLGAFISSTAGLANTFAQAVAPCAPELLAPKKDIDRLFCFPQGMGNIFVEWGFTKMAANLHSPPGFLPRSLFASQLYHVEG